MFDEGEVEDTVVIDEIKPSSQAKRFPMLKVGMICKEVRGEKTAGMDFDTIIEKITVGHTTGIAPFVSMLTVTFVMQNKDRPLQLAFGF